jgi:transporter family protein
MWLALAFVSATFLGLYDTSKKASLKDNAVLPVLLLNTIFSTIIFLPFLIDYVGGFGWFTGTFLDTAPGTDFSGLTRPALRAHLLVVLKACIVLSSWICGYFGLKHLPLTIVGPINATRPVLVLVGAMLIFGERLNAYQWTGVVLAIASIFLMSRAGKKENIDFKSNKWVWCVGLATLMGVISGLYDKHIMRSLNPMFVQSWFNFYQMIIMTFICAFLWYPKRHTTTPFKWRWTILLISLFICMGDFAYYTSLSDPDSLISVVSLVRRSSVIISFICAVIFFKERNLKAKLLDLAILLVGMAFIWMGTR